MDLTEIILRLVGVFYAFAGYVATRAALTSRFLDRAIAAISLQKPKRSETLQSVWLLCAATIVLTGGVALLLLLDIAAWLFLLAALGQAAYLFVVAPRYFDPEDPPEPSGRRQSTNAFVIYAAACAFVLWAAATGRLKGWHEVPAGLLVAAAVAVATHLVHVAYLLGIPSTGAPPFGGGDGNGDAAAAGPALEPWQSKRVKVMADYHAHPLWALDENLYGDFAPEALELSDTLTKDLNAWADAYTASLNPEDPASSLWSAEQHRAHAAAARPLAVRLARERPDLVVCMHDETRGGVVEVHADDAL
jgi:hypothetical protein